MKNTENVDFKGNSLTKNVPLPVHSPKTVKKSLMEVEGQEFEPENIAELQKWIPNYIKNKGKS